MMGISKCVEVSVSVSVSGKYNYYFVQDILASKCFSFFSLNLIFASYGDNNFLSHLFLIGKKNSLIVCRVVCCNQIATLGFGSHTHLIVALGYISHTN